MRGPDAVATSKPSPSETVEPSVQVVPLDPNVELLLVRFQTSHLSPSTAGHGDEDDGREDGMLGRCGKWPANCYRAYSMMPSRQPSSPRPARHARAGASGRKGFPTYTSATSLGSSYRAVATLSAALANKQVLIVDELRTLMP